MRLNAGFTMVELIVTMVIIGIMSVVVVPRMSLVGGFDSRGMRDQTIATLRYAQKSAIAQRRHICAVIDNSDITLTIASSFSTTTPTCSLASPLPTSLTYPASNCSSGTATVCRPSRVATTLASGTIIFDPSGRAISGAGTYAVSGGTSITIVASTGHVY